MNETSADLHHWREYEIIRIIALASARANWWILHIHSCGFREVRLADTRTPAEMDNDGVYEADEGLRCAVRSWEK